MRICIVGDLKDLSSTYVSWLAQQRGFDVLELREDSLGVDWSFAYSDTVANDGYVEMNGKRFLFSSLAGVFVRLHPEPELPADLDLPPEEAAVLIVERRHAIQHLLNSLPCPVVNRPYAGRSNGSKPYQMQHLARAGFLIPSWIASNDSHVVDEFSRQQPGGVIYKSCSGLRSKVRLLDQEVLSRLQDGTSPIVVQEYIAGYDVRLHVVRDQVFPTKITSHGIDYRFESEDNRFQETSAPEEIQRRCIEVARGEHLTIAGFDFRVSDEGKWYCLEVNPVPTFLPYEMSTGQPIGDAILDVFAERVHTAL